MAPFFLYPYMYTFMYTQVCTYGMCVHIQDTPLFPLKWWLTGTTEACAHSLCILHGKQRSPGDLRGSPLHPGAVATFQLSWPCEMAPSTSLTGWLGSSSVIWGTSTHAVCSAPHPGSYSKGPQDQWEPLWALALVLLEPFGFSLPTHTDTPDITVFPCSRPLKKCKLVTKTQTNKRLKFQW